MLIRRIAPGAAVMVALGGVGLEAYEQWWWYDNFAHALSGFAFTLLVVHGLHGRVLTGARRHPALHAIAIMMIGVALGTAWEAAEFGYDRLLASGNAIRGKVDTIADLAADTAGAFCVVVYLQFASR